jgi:tetratricopeptide (TPR) repeat protein
MMAFSSSTILSSSIAPTVAICKYDRLTLIKVPVLRINHTGSQVEAIFESDKPRLVERRPFSFALSEQDEEDIRWYLEEYPVYPVDPQPKIAKRIEKRMAQVGRELFKQVLAGSDVWENVRRNLPDTRIEVETEIEDALVPWELMRDPVADLPLVLSVSSFVRCHSMPAIQPNPPGPAIGKIRILLVICRLENDRVPFRSVARHLIRGLSEAAREPFDLEVLRPPTFEELAKRLRAAKAQGGPFHVVHFDGHGLSGQVFFENPKLKKNAQPVKAADFGKILHETHVPLLILNACRSADCEPLEQPAQAGDLHEQIRQFGSFAHAVMDYGMSGVVAWRYSVFVDTAAQYMAELYGSLASGLPLGEAATLARKSLSSGGREIEDWTVPVVFEAFPIQLFPKTEETFRVKLEARATSDSGLPHAPDIGFIGRDETILKLDRTFDEQNIVLLHAYAGSGKTSAAREFALWYQQTSDLSGPVLFTSFEQHKTLPQVLDALGRVFEEGLAKSGIQWLTLDDAQRRDVALQGLRQVPVFWIWDNVEPIAGFPSGTPSAWSAAEQKELVDFLRAARGTKAKFLLTSRRDERDWLHDLAARIELPPMPFDERVQMAEELAKRLSRRFDEVEDWRPLLRFTQGNPMTLTSLVSQALRDRLRSRKEIEDFVCKVQAGELAFEDEASEGRKRSLAASLAYGFDNAFTEGERKQLALLHFFQGVVNVDVLHLMGMSSVEWCLAEVKGLTFETWNALLDRAEEVGLSMRTARGYYRIHPALPWFFRQYFEQYYRESRLDATRAFVMSTGESGDHYFDLYEEGSRGVIGALSGEEANLLNARNLARSYGWWPAVIGSMQGLGVLYRHTGRLAEWSRLVNELVPDLFDPATEGPLPGKDKPWSMVIEYRVRLAQEARLWDKAEALEKIDLDWNRQLASPILSKDPVSWTAVEKEIIRTLGVSVHELAQIRRLRGSSICVDGYREALALAELIADSQLAGHCAHNLGVAYGELVEIQDLGLEEQWYKRALQLFHKDRMGQARCFLQLGAVAFRRFLKAREGNMAVEECLREISEAESYSKRALSMFPPDAVGDLASAHLQLGNIYANAGQIDAALRHCRESIGLFEVKPNRFPAGQVRWIAANALARDFQASQDADKEVVKILKLLGQIESELRGSSQPS